MFDDQSVLIIFFRVLNFAVIIALCIYLYRRYVRKQTEQTIQDQETLAKGMEELSYMLEGQLLELDEEIALQQRRCLFLKNKVIEWQQAVYEHREKDAQLRSQIVQRVNDRLHARAGHLAYIVQMRPLIPQSFAKAQEQLQQQFSEPQKQKQFLNDLVQHMRNI